MKKEKETLHYETAYAELQKIIAGLQNETISIDDLAAKIARAQELVQFCRQRLRETEAQAGKLFD